MIEPSPAQPFTWTRQPWGRALCSSRLAAAAHHLFTTRDLVLRGPGEEDGWAHLAAATRVQPERLVRLEQVHGTGVVVVTRGAVQPDAGWTLSDDGRPRADAVMTDDPGFAVAVQVADCVPLLLADPVTGAVAAVHAGWRGTAAGIAGVAVAAMRAHFSARPADLLAAIGPSIGPCCYQVGADVLEVFRAAGFPAETLRQWFRPDQSGREPATSRDSRHRLDVPRATIDQLKAAGVAAANIDACGLCTACHPLLFPSYRRDGAGTGRIAGAIRPGGDLG